MVLGMGEIDRFLEQWEMDAPVHQRLIPDTPGAGAMARHLGPRAGVPPGGPA